MLKEIVDFSKQLEIESIYTNIQKSKEKIEMPIVVVPAKDDLSGFDVDNIYFVFKDCKFINSKLLLKLDSTKEKGKEKEIEIQNANSINSNVIKKISDFNNDQDWKNILLNCKMYIQKFPGDSKGNKSIGRNEGTNSYHILIFEANEKNLLNPKKDFKDFKEKIKKTYNEENIKKGVFNNNKQLVRQLVSLLEKFNSITCQLYSKIDCMKNLTSLKSFIIVIKLPKIYYKCYKEWYEEYLKKKIFKTEEKQYLIGKCSACSNSSNSNSNELWLPEIFQNLDQGKPFIKHLGRKQKFNIAVCRDCSLYIYKFQTYFLNMLKISTFPLFIESKLRDEAIAFIKQNNEKLNFRDIIQEIYRKTYLNELDFYLIIYNRSNDFIAFDYVTGFNFYKNGMSIFEIETLISKSFFTNSKNYDMLLNNYFSDKVETKEKELDNLIYKYRGQIFDYIYRAKYNSLNSVHILDMYISSLKIKLRYLYNPDIKEYEIIKRIKSINVNFLKLDKYFGGNYMETIEEIKKTKEIKDKESFAYYSGQIVYYLLTRSEKTNKTHAMVEPFINVATLGTFAIKLIELFNMYKHSINLSYNKFNNIMASICGFLCANQNEKFTIELKMFFYAGYFDDNIFFEKNENIEEGVSHGN